MISRSRGAGFAAALAVAAAVGGCGSTATVTTGPYWLVKVDGNYATVYQYPSGNTPATPHRVELGTKTRASDHEILAAAASKLGVPMSHVTFEATP